MMNATSQSSFSSKHKKHTPPVKTPTTGLFVIGYPAKLWIIDPRGKLHKDEEGLISVMDPKAGFYKLIFWPKERKSQLIVAQILENDQNLWREYTVRQLVPYVHLPRIYTLKFNASHPKEDILH